MAIAFGAVSLSTGTNHCLAACDGCADGPVTIAEAPCGSPFPEPAPQGHDSPPAPECPGPSCLCHQHPIVTDEIPVPAVVSSISHRQDPPALPDLGVVREIHHVPKGLS